MSDRSILLDNLKLAIEQIESKEQRGNGRVVDVTADVDDSVCGSARKHVNQHASCCAESDGFSSEAAFRKIVRCASASEQSSAKMRVKLRAAGFGDQECENAMSRALELRIIDDARYCESLVRSELSKGKGLRLAEAEIADLGLTLEDLPPCKEMIYDLPPEETRAYDFLVAHPPRGKNLRQSAYRKLVTKGYSSSAAATASRKWVEDGSRN